MIKKITLISCISLLCFFIQAQTPTVGLILNDSSSYNGYTLFPPSSGKTTYLVDNCGYQVNSWTSEYKAGLSAYLLENGNLIRTAKLQNNNFTGGGSGGRVELFNWEGDLIWSYNLSNSQYYQHHDIEPLPNGNVLILAWEAIPQAAAIAGGRSSSLVSTAGVASTYIVEIEPVNETEGNIVWEWRLWDHTIQDIEPNIDNFGVISEHPELVDVNYSAFPLVADWVHVNAIDYNAELDQIILSSRDFNELWIIDHSTSTEEAAGHTGGNQGKGGDLLYRWGNPISYQRGTTQDQQLFGQHDAHWIPDSLVDGGKIMVFNNGINRPQGEYSTIDIIAPPLTPEGAYTIETGQAFGPSELSWQYTENAPSFYSSRISGAQRLPNGNTYICEGNSGRFFEVDPEGNKTWEYINPVKGGFPVQQGFMGIFQNEVFRSYRYSVDYPAFEGKELIPGDPVELSPWDSDCVIYDGTQMVDTTMTDTTMTDTTMVDTTMTDTTMMDTTMTAIWFELALLENIKIIGNPISDQLVISNEFQEEIIIEIYDLSGKKILSKKYNKENITFDSQNWSSGLYIVKISSKTLDKTMIHKVLKI